MQNFKIYIGILISFMLIFSFVLPCFAEEETMYVWSSSTNSLNGSKSSNSAATNSSNENLAANNSTNENSITDNHGSNSKTVESSISTDKETVLTDIVQNDTDENTTKNSNTVATTADSIDNNSLNLESGSAILIEQTTGQVLYEHNSHEQLRPASVTKVMSMLLIMEQLNNGNLTYDTQISCSQNSASMGGSQIWLDTKETLSVDEMLKAICVVSANDCDVQK